MAYSYNKQRLCTLAATTRDLKRDRFWVASPTPIAGPPAEVPTPKPVDRPAR